MTFQDERKSTADERIDRLSQWLELTLGARLVAYAVGVSVGEIVRFASGEQEPADAVEQRLRNLYQATWFVAASDGPGYAHDWLLEPNPRLENRSAAELLRDGETPEPVWFTLSPAF
jgi:hypothetical protein